MPEMSAGIHPQFASRCHHWIGQDLEATDFFQGQAEKNFFAGKVSFVESAYGLEVLPAGKKERAGAEPAGEIEEREHPDQKCSEPRHIFVGQNSRATAGITFGESRDSF